MNDIQNTATETLPRQNRWFTLQAKVLVLISTVISVVFIAAVAVAMYLIHDERRADLEARAKFLADVQSAGLARPIWDFEFEQASGMLNTLTQDPDFRYAAVEAANGDTISAFGDALEIDETAVFIVRRDIMHRSEADASAAGKRVGTLTLALSEGRLRDSLTNMVFAGLVLLGVMLAFVISAATGALKMMTRPLGGIARAMAGLAAGDLATPVPSLARNDEVGEMARAVQIFKENAEQKATLEQEQALAKQHAEEERRRSVLELADRFEVAVKDVVTRVSSAASEMETTAQDMSSTAEQTTQQSESVATASDEVTDNVQSVAATAEQLSSSIAEISRQVNQSASVAAKAVREAEKTTATVHSLSTATGKIGEVVTLINEIAGQTNLLALNATIEAARAGDAGKGFAVVAQEVKNLANQTAKATEEIGLQINAVQTETTSVVGAIDRITGIIGEINEISAIIAAAIEEQGVSTDEIARRVQSAAEGTMLVNTNIGGVSHAAGETGSAATKVLSASREVSQQAGGLSDAVDSFVNEIRAN